MQQDRYATRLPVELPARYRTRRLVAPGQVADLSEQGCRIRGFPPGGRIGDRIRICLEGLEPLWGEVKWMRNGDAGVQFDRSLHPAVVQHITEKCRTGYGAGWTRAG